MLLESHQCFAWIFLLVFLLVVCNDVTFLIDYAFYKQLMKLIMVVIQFKFHFLKSCQFSFKLFDLFHILLYNSFMKINVFLVSNLLLFVISSYLRGFNVAVKFSVLPYDGYLLLKLLEVTPAFLNNWVNSGFTFMLMLCFLM